MEGGTEYRFVTSGIQHALEQAIAAANGKDVWLGGGVSAIRQYLEARLVDGLPLAADVNGCRRKTSKQPRVT